MTGWVKLHRQLKDWEWYGDPPVVTLFIHFLLTANYKPGKWRGIDLEPGQLVAGRIALAEATGLSQQQVRTALDKLQQTTEIHIKATNQFSIITIVNWDKWQATEEEATNDQPARQPAKKPTSNQQSTTSKEGNNISSNEEILTPAKPKAKTASRLADDWTLPEDWKAWALTETHLNEAAIIREGAIFGDYWKAKSGKDATKADWLATWRNWIRRKENDVSRNPSLGKGHVQNTQREPGRTIQANQTTAQGSGFGGRRSQTELVKDRADAIIRRREAAAGHTPQFPGLSSPTDDHA